MRWDPFRCAPVLFPSFAGKLGFSTIAVSILAYLSSTVIIAKVYAELFTHSALYCIPERYVDTDMGANCVWCVREPITTEN